MLTAGCGGGRGEHPSSAERQDPPIEVATAAASMHEGPELLEAGGTVRGHMSATLASRVMAPVRAVLVAPGERVREGQPLVLLDDRDVAAAARQARAHADAAARGLEVSRAEQEAADAALVLARATHARTAALYERKSATAQELDQAVAALRAADTRVARVKAASEEARESLAGAVAGGEAATVTASFTRIVAPFTGLVTEKLVEPGNLVTPGAPLLRLEDTRSYKLDVRVDESRAAWVERNAPVSVRADTATGPTEIPGRVSEIARAIDADSRAFLVTIALPANDALRPGMYARALLPGPSRRMLRVPETAVVRRGQLTSVFVVDGRKARLRLVSTGRSSAGQTDILAGLTAGESVVIAPPPALRDGASLTLRVAAAAPAAAAAPPATKAKTGGGS